MKVDFNIIQYVCMYVCMWNTAVTDLDMQCECMKNCKMFSWVLEQRKGCASLQGLSWECWGWPAFWLIQCLSITEKETIFFGSGRLGKNCSQSVDPAEFVPATLWPKDGHKASLYTRSFWEY